MTILQKVLALFLCFGWIPRSSSFGQTQHHSNNAEEEDDETLDDANDGDGDDNMPSILDRDDISYFFDHGMDDLFDVLQFLFERSIRIPMDEDDESFKEFQAEMIPLPDRLIHRGSGSTFTTRAKLRMDLEQALYLASVLTDETEVNFFKEIAAPIYQQALDNIPASNADSGLYFFTEKDYENAIDLVYNRAWRPTFMEPEVDASTGDFVPLLNAAHDSNNIQQQWKNGQGVVIIDDFLTPQALSKIQQILLQSTVWFESNTVAGSYTSAAHLDDGLFDKLLLRLAYETRDLVRPIMPDEAYVLHDLFARKYDVPSAAATASSASMTTDDVQSKTFLVEGGDPLSAIHVHLWLSPPSSLASADSKTIKGDHDHLVVFTAKPPQDWPHTMGPTGAEVLDTIIQPSGFANVTVPFQVNRAVVFDATLFHKKSIQLPLHSDQAGGYDDDDDAVLRYQKRLTELVLLYGNKFYGDDEGQDTEDEL
ncbi:hypothetical protein ACA910_003912 [Epithemia clementina (nom. ined.)]